jgi:hypothetical protein
MAKKKEQTQKTGKAAQRKTAEYLRKGPKKKR